MERKGQGWQIHFQKTVETGLLALGFDPFQVHHELTQSRFVELSMLKPVNKTAIFVQLLDTKTLTTIPLTRGNGILTLFF